MISPLAYIHPEAKIGENVEIAPFVFIDKNVVIGDNNKIMANANILYGSRIGNGNTIFPGAVIGAIPQDLKFQGEESTAEIGDNNTIRENVTINRGTAAKGRTIIGNNNLLMEGVHVAHDALVGNYCIIGNSTKMAGEIVIDDFSIISANVLMHQFCRVGGYAPLAPKKPKISPCFTSKEIWSTAVKWPNRLTSCDTRMRGVSLVEGASWWSPGGQRISLNCSRMTGGVSIP